MLADRKSRSFIEPQVIARLAGVPLVSRRAMQGNVSGRHVSPHRGASVEFAEYRKYVPGDDLRRLDWRAYGRSDRYYIKEFEADTNLRCCLVLDASGSMGFGSHGLTKLQYARQIAATIAYLAVQQGDAAGLTCVAQGITQQLPPKRNAAHLSNLFDTLERTEASGPTRLIEVLHELAETVRQRALVVIVSDFFLPPEELRSCFEHLRFRRHDVAAFQLLDPSELDFPFQRPMRFLDMEGGPAVFADPALISQRYHSALTTHLDALRVVVMETGVDYQQVNIAQPYEEILMRFLVGRLRSRGRR